MNYQNQILKYATYFKLKIMEVSKKYKNKKLIHRLGLLARIAD